MTDDMLRALAENGGVVHINYFEGFLDNGFEERFDGLQGRRRRGKSQIDERRAEIRRPQRERCGGAQDQRRSGWRNWGAFRSSRCSTISITR